MIFNKSRINNYYENFIRERTTDLYNNIIFQALLVI